MAKAGFLLYGPVVSAGVVLPTTPAERAALPTPRQPSSQGSAIQPNLPAASPGNTLTMSNAIGLSRADAAAKALSGARSGGTKQASPLNDSTSLRGTLQTGIQAGAASAVNVPPGLFSPGNVNVALARFQASTGGGSGGSGGGGGGTGGSGGSGATGGGGRLSGGRSVELL